MTNRFTLPHPATSPTPPPTFGLCICTGTRAFMHARAFASHCAVLSCKGHVMQSFCVQNLQTFLGGLVGQVGIANVIDVIHLPAWSEESRVFKTCLEPQLCGNREMESRVNRLSVGLSGLNGFPFSLLLEGPSCAFSLSLLPPPPPLPFQSVSFELIGHRNVTRTSQYFQHFENILFKCKVQLHLLQEQKTVTASSLSRFPFLARKVKRESCIHPYVLLQRSHSSDTSFYFLTIVLQVFDD